MTILNGKSVCGGIAVGEVCFFKRTDAQVRRTRTDDVSGEMERFGKAREQSIQQLRQLYEKALDEVGSTNAQIFEIHRMMLEDEDYNDSVVNIITTQRVNAEYAVAVTADNFAAMLSSMQDEYMKARAADVRDISNRLIRALNGGGTPADGRDGKFIICADDLAPSETVQLDKRRVLAFVTRHGSANSHTAILARSMNIPAVIGAAELSEDADGKTAVVDGFSGTVYLDPDRPTLDKMKAQQSEELRRRELLQKLKGKPSVTADGTRIKICANISGAQDIGEVLLNDAEGIGLFRSEFLYLERSDFPSEQLQFAAYKKVLESMSGKKVVIRTLDVGADKRIDYFGLAREENPALGLRAIRICLTRQDIFKTQLKALYRASVYGNLAIMFPMIAAAEEVAEIKRIIAEVKSELDAEGLEYSKGVETGIMIETPAAAVISDILAQQVDFFSVGTNDLIQYTLAADRQNPELERFCNPHHEAVLRLIRFAAESAHRHGKWIGICGELAADTELTESWLSMGIDELSVSPPLVLPVRDRVRHIRLNLH